MSVPASVTIGGTSRTVLRELLADAGVRLNALAEQLFADGRFRTAREASLVRVVAVDVSTLGFPAGATFGQLAGAARRRGLSLCPLELGPHLRLQYQAQPVSCDDKAIAGTAPPGSITVASAPPPDDEPVPWGFYLRRIGADNWLRGYRSGSAHVWAPDDVLVFVRADDAR